MCGSCANEGALKAAFMAYRARERGESGTQEFTPEEVRPSSFPVSQRTSKSLTAPTLHWQLSSCMKNASPGTPDLVAMSFKHGFHGRLFGSLSLTRSKAIHKVIPAFWH